MSRKIIASLALAAVLVVAGCNHHVKNPMAGIDSKQPDKGLYDRAMEAMQKGRFTEARSLLETLINTYQESEYIARAKLALGDSWYAEGGTAAWTQAEAQYKDFQVFYPNMPEAAEAQLKVATIHYRQMEKADRDFTQAMRASEEYRNLIQQYPDSPLVPEAKQRLREVQEVLADRQFRIASFYYLRDNFAASQARLQSLIDSYPLYSHVDEALYELGNLYEREAVNMKKQNIADAAAKERMVAQFQKNAIDDYTRIVTRYPAMGRANDAKRRLQALNVSPLPQPTAEQLAESKAEEQSRSSVHMTDEILGNFRKHPSVSRASKVGEPSLDDEKQVSAVAMVQDLTNQLNAAAKAGTATTDLGLTTVGAGSGTPAANQPPPGTASAPDSAQPPAANGAQPPPDNTATPSTTTPPAAPPSAAAAPSAGTSSTSSSNSSATAAQQGEGAPPPAAPPQVNEIKKTGATTATNDQQANSGTQQQTSADSKQDSSSKKKSKKGLRRIIPF
jgi:outer membrane protein assembly factor BamD